MTHCKHCGQETTAAAELAVSKMINADLLAALEAMLEYDTGTPDDVLNMARAAIAKAKGAQ
ncbi:DNA-directed RNA polymerase [Caudoviricetes sp.]|nr:DNA-directed RNA polymerase [Caudoviricetes sp.]